MHKIHIKFYDYDMAAFESSPDAVYLISCDCGWEDYVAYYFKDSAVNEHLKDNHDRIRS